MSAKPDTDTLFTRFNRLLQSNAVEEAHALLRLGLVNAATRPEALLWRGILALRVRQYPQAFLYLANAQAFLPEQASILALLAQAARSQGAWSVADTLAELAIERDPLNLVLQASLHAAGTDALSHLLLPAEVSPYLPPFIAPPPPNQEPATQPVDILIPVYRGYADTMACLESVLTAQTRNQTPHEIIVLDDAAPEQELVIALDHLANTGAITLVRHPVNLGFIRGMNRGMALHANRDVVWLNADTRVCGHWLDRLRETAYQDRRTASVTPFSNCGELMTFPMPRQSYPMPDTSTQSALDALAARVWNGQIPVLEVGCGFCLYVKRLALADVGYLDEAELAGGYGEDTDWCLRAKAQGWQHVGAPQVFVAHRGNVSFGADKRWRVARNNAVLRQRFPRAELDYREHNRRDPIKPFREALQRARLPTLAAWIRQSPRPLHLLGADGLDDPRLPFYTPPGTSPPDGLLWLSWQAGSEGMTVTLNATGLPLPFLLNYRWPTAQKTLLADLRKLPISGLIFHKLADCPFLDLPNRLHQPYVLHSLDDALLEAPTAFAQKAKTVLLPYTALLPRYQQVHPQTRWQVDAPPTLTGDDGRAALSGSLTVAIADRLSPTLARRWLNLARHFAQTDGPRLLLLEPTPWEQELQATGQVFQLTTLTGLAVQEWVRWVGCGAAVSLDDNPGAGWIAPSWAYHLNLPLYAPPSAVSEAAGALPLTFEMSA